MSKPAASYNNINNRQYERLLTYEKKENYKLVDLNSKGEVIFLRRLNERLIGEYLLTRSEEEELLQIHFNQGMRNYYDALPPICVADFIKDYPVKKSKIKNKRVKV